MTKTMEELEAEADQVRLALGVDNPEDKLRALIIATAQTINEAYGIYGDSGIEMKGREVVRTLERFIAERRYGNGRPHDVAGPDREKTAAKPSRAKGILPEEPGSNVIQFAPVREITVTIPEKLHRWIKEEAESGEFGKSFNEVAVRALDEALCACRFDFVTMRPRP